MRLSPCFIMLTAIICLVGASICFNGCGNDSPKSSSRSSQEKASPSSSKKAMRITYSQALASAKNVMKDSEWKLCFLSNTGVAGGPVTGQFQDPSEALMLPDGTAGQWVVGLFKDIPALSHDLLYRIAYPDVRK